MASKAEKIGWANAAQNSHCIPALLNTSASSNVGCRQKCTPEQAESIYLGPVLFFISSAHVSYSCEPLINKQVGITFEHLWLSLYCAQEENTSVHYFNRKEKYT